MSESPAVIVRRHGAVAEVTLNRPDVLNAINTAVREGIVSAIRRADHDDRTRVIVLSGAGERAFCAGADITEFREPDSFNSVRAAKHALSFTETVAEASKPVIAAIHGFCLGGGLELALACDIRIASAEAQFGFPEVTLGIIPGAGGTQRLPRIVGVGAALRMILTGERIDANEAFRIGVVSQVVERAQLAKAARQLALRLAESGPLALRYAKEAVVRGSQMALRDGIWLEGDLSTLLAGSRDRMEGASAFRERRRPVFRGE